MAFFCYIYKECVVYRRNLFRSEAWQGDVDLIGQAQNRVS